MGDNRDRNSYLISAALHVVIILVFALSLEFTSPIPVVENTNKNDVISAVVLGDTENSKILPQKPVAQPVKKVEKVEKEEPKIEKEEIKPKELPKPKEQAQEKPKPKPIDHEAIALALEKKKLEKEKELQKELEKEEAALAKKQREDREKDLLADLEKQKEKNKKKNEKKLQSKYEKMLREQAEKSLRQQLLDENIKVQGSQTREAHGEVDKYRALIIQAISEHWIVPAGADKHLTAVLMIRLAPGGMVLDVQVTKTSGDPSLDSSARAAVLKASPLPVPTNPDEFEAFRKFVLKVKPENILPTGNELG